MKVCFPNFGSLGIVLETLCRQQQISYVKPQENLEEALRVGTRLCPQSVCLPMKRLLGEFVMAAQQGADTALFLGGGGPCRFGYFAPMFQTILDDEKIHMRVWGLEAPAGNRALFLKDFSRLLGVNQAKALRLLLTGVQTLRALDNWEETRLTATALLGEEGTPPKERSAPNMALLQTLLAGWQRKWRPILRTAQKAQGAAPLRIGIIGDIYTTIDPAINQNLQLRLAEMGAVTRRSIRLSDHLLHLVFGNPWQNLAARPYLNRNIGGFARETIGAGEQMRRAGFDGLIQVYPLSCMPEIVADGILTDIRRKQGIPILRLVLDEHSAQAGLQTRLEAFVDMLKRRRMAG